jgi:hypothetical protein
MSWNDIRNKPQGKSTQFYYCVKPWEGKHIAGKQHTKQHEFAAKFGVSIETDTGRYYYPGRDYHGKFKISGNPQQVDACMEAMSKWLQECLVMHYDKF